MKFHYKNLFSHNKTAFTFVKIYTALPIRKSNGVIKKTRKIL